MGEERNYSLDDYRQENDLVRCAKCGALISAYATRCPECGVHFRGEACDFARPGPRRPKAVRMLAWMALAVVIVAAAGLALTTIRC